MENRKLILRMAGGLGNQLFELAYAINQAKKNKIESIILDDSSLSSYKAKHTNHLKKFFDFTNLEQSIKYKNSFITKLRLPRFFGFKFTKWFLVSDKNKDYVKFFHSTTILDGYFIWALNQNDFDETCSILKNYLLEPISNTYDDNECVIHIRGGDFVELGWNKLTPDSYYLNAMNIMASKYNIKKFIVITDDIKYAKSLLTQSSYQYEVQNNDMKTDFYTIANAPMKIIGGSSFAIWASALGYDNNDGILIAPSWDVKLPNQIDV